MNDLLSRCLKFADAELRDCEVTNPDAKTLAQHAANLADQLEQEITDYITQAEQEALKDAEARDQAAYERSRGL